ncbi:MULTISPECIES: caspase family protein [unclassified Bradyrhizobium]|uniref:caspase family protein n=1 Tax=unclassified Bradyrhizobium TaxID=2631580 RepID=UPI0028F040AC|nr:MULTISPECIES: caspase family protein [unclassified Bradyrhizobium]
MLRLLPLLLLLIVPVLPAFAGPVLSDDPAVCRSRQAELATRASACERLLEGGNLTGKDLALALDIRGLVALNKHEDDKAIEALTAALAADPDNVTILNRRGYVYERRGKDELALADYDAAVQKRPTFGIAYNNRGTIHLRRGALQSALDDFNAAIRAVPTLYLGYVNRGRVRALMGEHDAALADYEQAEKIDAAAPLAAMYRSETLTAMGRPDEAIAGWTGIIERSPKNQFAIVGRADAHLRKGDLDAALKDLNAVLALNPNNVHAHASRGQLFEKRGNVAQARADYRAAAFALTTYDPFDVARARKLAQERLAALTPQTAGAASNARRVALVIGNGGYKSVHALPNPPRDARLIADTLRATGFQSVTLVSDLSRDRFFEALRSFEAEAEKADWAVVYYAGHGFEIGGVNYLVPIDAKLAADKDAETEAVALEQVLAAVGAARKLRLVILDACRDNPFAPGMKQTLALKLVDKGFSNIEPGAGMMVVYAAKHGATALDGDGGNSPFATALARTIKEPRLEVRKLFDIVRDDVWAATKQRQQPFTYGSPPGREDFFFVAAK